MTTEETLARLQRTYGQDWRIWRSTGDDGRPAAWVATNLNPHSRYAPTLHAGTAEGLERELSDPPPAYGVSLAGSWGC